MLKKFCVQNFRALLNEEMEFGTVNLFLGPNNCGKTTLIEAVHFLPRMVSKEIAPKRTAFLDFIDGNGWDEIPNRAQSSRSVKMKYTLDAPEWDNPLVYDMSFEAGQKLDIPHGFYISRESLMYENAQEGYDQPFCFFKRESPDTGRFSVKRSGKKEFPPLALEKAESVFRQDEELLKDSGFRNELYPVFSDGLKKARESLGVFRSYSSTDIRLDLMRFAAKPEDEDRYLLSDGSNLARVLLSLREKDEGYLNDLSEQTSAFVKGLEGFSLDERADGTVQLFCKISGSSFSLNELSDGTKKLLVHLFLLTSPLKMDALSLDEPELNLHPAWLGGLARKILKAGNASRQIFVSTHSPDLLDGLTEAFRDGSKNLKIFVKGNSVGKYAFKSVKLADLESFFEEGWELGDLYRVGEPMLGGWPF